ncbi:Tat pathway signal protein [Haloferula helveola]|uniref:Tat pathway signal protein n=1 Tax=Haloferula helveola TaxID=490095 RepID=A0ABN6H0R1_9BACT|nr:Tat pathway signal protein [Haloferula helveola]
MNTRRDFLKTAFITMGGLSLPGGMQRLSAAPTGSGKAPMRFIFMHRGNGLFPKVMVPPSFGPEEMKKENAKEAFEVDLDGHELPDWMSPLEAHKDNLTILQGLSGKMCTVGHHSWCSSLGVYKANERPSSIKWATVDFELAKLFPSPMEHIELACFPTGGGNARGSLDGIAKGFSARGPQQPNYAFGSPKIAVDEIFKSVSANEDDQVRYQLERKVLEFAAGNHSEIARQLDGIERQKVGNYAESIEDIRERNRKVDMMADAVRRHAPKLDAKYLAEELSTLDRQVGHTEVLLSSLISGLTNVVAFTVDELGHEYTGIPGLEGEKVNMHDVGHGKVIGGVNAEEIRKRSEHHHMKLVDMIVTRLKSVPEGDGTMFDNTMVFYFPDGGETHHSHGTEFPFVVMAGDNAKLSMGRRYVRLPYWGSENHKTLGNFYTTILNAYGNPIKHFGVLDPALIGDQTGAIKEFLM